MGIRTSFILLAMPLLGALWSSGCTMPPGTIIREKDILKNGQLVTTDARQRVITSQMPDISTKPGVVVPSNITCVEPQPSVALSLANSFGVGVSVFQEGSGALSSAVSEGVFQLDERTIAIQALLNAGYQNCLDYSNGAITNTFYAIRASNLDNLLVTMTLASESAGNLRSALGSAGGTAESSGDASQSFLPGAISDIQDSASKLGDARRKTEKAAAKLEKAKEDQAKAHVATVQAEDALKNPPENADTAELTRVRDEKKKEEKTADGEVEKADAEHEAAKQDQQDLEQAMSSQIDAAASASTSSTAEAAKGPSGRPTDTAVLTMGEMQRRFLERSTASQNITACLVELGLATADPKPGQATFEREMWDAIKKGPGATAVKIDDFVILSRSERDSKLVTFCSNQLPFIVANAQAAEQNLAMERVRNERIEVALHLMEALTKRSEQCTALPETDDAAKKIKSECFKQLMAVQQFVQRELS